MATPPDGAANPAIPDASRRPPLSSPRGATWLQRGAAFGLDAIVLLAIASATETALVLLGTGDVLLAPLAGSVAFAYFLLGSLLGGRTPGKRFLRLRTLAESGARPSAAQAALDALGGTIILLGLLGAAALAEGDVREDLLLALLAASGDVLGGLLLGGPRRQRLVQRASRTVVVFEPPPAPKRVVFVP